MNERRIEVDWSKCRGEGQFRQKSFRWLLQEQVDVAGRRIVDLGAGPCAFARIAAEFGADVTAVDGRDVRVPDDVKENLIEEKKGNGAKGWFSRVWNNVRVNPEERRLGKGEGGVIRFIFGDVRDVELNSYDLVVIFGLLYHFDITDQMALLDRCRGKTVLIDTMVCCPDLVTRYPGERWQCAVERRAGFEGWVYPEKDNPMAAIGNATSFWHTEESYLKLFSQSGFWAYGTSVDEIANKGIPMNKIVVGKPVTSSDVNNSGFVPQDSLAQIFTTARNGVWSNCSNVGGVMGWKFSSDTSGWMMQMKQSINC